MALRTPSATFRRSPVWRRSGDESHWDSFISETERERPTSVSQPSRRPRPQSAIEGRHLATWLEHLQTMQSKIKTPVDNKAPYLNDQTRAVQNKDPSGHVWKQKCRSSSLYDTSSLCESSFSSQDSLRTGFFCPPRQRGSWERAHFLQTPRKERAQVSDLAPVQTGWLPVQRKVMVADTSKQNQFLDQVKLKQPITPMFQRTQGTLITQDGELEKSRSSTSALGVKTWQTHNPVSSDDKQVTEGHHSGVDAKGRLVSWQALKRGWNTSRLFPFPGSKKSNVHPKRNNADSSTSSPLKDTTSTATLKQSSPYCTDSAAFIGSPTPPEGTNPTGTCGTNITLQRTRVVQPLRATLPLSGMDTWTQPSHIQTTSAVATSGISSITISSRKVTKSASLPGSCTSSRSPSPTLDNQSMHQNSSQGTTHRKATILKVTESRVISKTVRDTGMAGISQAGSPLETAVHRRKAMIIKVTEHRESYRPPKKGPKNPENRHSYTEGPIRRLSLDNQWQRKTEPSNDRLHSGPQNAVTTNGTLHRSTLCLFVNSPKSVTARDSSDVSPKVGGPTSDRPRRPLSCYGNLMGHTETNMEIKTRPATRRLSSGHLVDAPGNFVNPGSSFIHTKKSSKKEVEPVADTIELNGRKEKMFSPPGNAMRRMSPCLTLIKAPDPNSNQSPEEVLALNAAAIIANIKLQRELSMKKKTPNGDVKNYPTVTTQGNTDEMKSIKSDQRCTEAGFVPLCSDDDDQPPDPVSLQQALEKFRPDFISRSQGRIRELERKARERRDVSRTDAALSQRKAHSDQSASPKDNLFRSRDGAITGKEFQLRPKQMPAEVKRKRDEDRRRKICLSNRQRVDLFKKRVLNKLLHRSNI
ncbi:(E2-independent) E3 ubiquitin-conjugating enzyme FATS [Gouania willdenowi]|uniref:(E2-independent) E3 ubiquitin-conjugating enzyme FATS n=1 Tax=Gouania willdenowi TaxID=441366 RepID=UPI001056C577|nr:uncharacterized protein LOC114481054 [Gouania willdenowi]